MDAITLNLFPTAVHQVRTKGWDKYKGYLLDSINNQPDPSYRPRAGYYTDYGKPQPWRKKSWGEFIQPELRPFIASTQTKLQDIWAQQYIDQAGFTTHRHQPTGYSCVLYAEFDPNEHWATTLFRPFLDPNDVRNVNDCYTPKVEEGEILIFPSWMLHQATPSDSLVPRTIVAFNLEEDLSKRM